MIVRGKNCGVMMHCGGTNMKIVEVCGQRKQSVRCCGRLAEFCLNDAQCKAFQEKNKKKTVVVRRLEPRRIIKRRAIANPGEFRRVAEKLLDIARDGGWTTCREFFQYGICRRSEQGGPKCIFFPCNNKTPKVTELLREAQLTCDMCEP